MLKNKKEISSVSLSLCGEKRIGLCFCHGWGFHPDYWKPLISHFEGHPIKLWNLGYFGEQDLPLPDASVDQWIAVGHSIGFRKLMECDVKWAGAVALQGFFDFLGSDPRMRAIRQRTLTQMIRDWEKSPEPVLSGFHAACQIASPSFLQNQKASWETLEKDLRSLADPGKFLWPLSIPSRILGSRDDAIVRPALMESEWGKETILWSEKGGHALGFFESDFVAESIHSLLREI